MRSFSLKRILALAFLCVAIIPVIVASVTVHEIVSQSIRSEIISKNQILARSLAGEVNRFLKEPIALMRYAAATLSEKDSTDCVSAMRRLDALTTQGEYFDKVIIFDKSGIVKYVSPDDENYFGINLSNQPVFQNPRRIEKPYFSTSFISLQTQRPTLTISIAFGGGVIAGEINLDSLSAITNNAKIKSSGFVAVLDNNKTCIAYPDQRKVDQQIKLNLNQPDDSSKELQKIQIEGKSFFVNMAVVPLSGWITVVFQPVDEAFETLKWIQRVFWFAGVGAFCITLILIFFIVRKLYHPFADLNADMEKISKGHYDISPSISIFNEFNRLAEGMQTMSREIKDREIALKESGNRFQELFENMYDGVAIYRVENEGEDFVFVDINKSGERISAVKKETIIGQPVTKIFPGIREMGLFEVFNRVYQTGKMERFPVSQYKDDRLSIWVDNSVFKVPSGEIMAVYRDDTERQKALEELQKSESEIRDLNRELENRVSQRTAQLEKTMHYLESSNKELESFAYIASHDLQEPLRKVQAFSDRLKTKYADVLDEQGIDYLTRLESSGRRMQAMVNDLLVFSRVKTRGEAFITVNLYDIVKDVIVDLEIRAKETSASIEIDDLPSIEADPRQMHQLFSNLISNAIKFHTEDVSPSVRIFQNLNSAMACDSNFFCEIVVQDNGIGFEEQYLDRIFKPFQRLHGKGEYEGTGIGLSICHRIVDRHGGRITAKSQVGHGTKFIINLPIQQNSEE